jgi:hypothetical protein
MPDASIALILAPNAVLFVTGIVFHVLTKLYIYNTYGGVCVTYVIETYQRRLNSKPYVLFTTFGRTNDFSNKSFLSLLFSNPEVGVQFLEVVGLI